MASADGAHAGYLAGKTCRKSVLKLLKYFRDQIVDNNSPSGVLGLNSYHLKTLMLHTFDEYPHHEDWARVNILCMFKLCLDKLIEHLETCKMMHYFIHDVNILHRKDLPDLPEDKRKFWIRQFKVIRERYHKMC